MNRRLRFAGSTCLLFVLAGPASAEVHDLANLVPARTLAYLELHDPSRLARELHALVKGSYLQNPVSFYAHQAKKRNMEEVFLFAWLASPEFIDELGDWQGGCMALTGFTKDGNPEIVGAMRTGKSRMLPLALGIALMESGEVRCIARVEGVPILQIGDAEKRKRPEIARRAWEPAATLVRLLRGPRPRATYAVARLEDMPVGEAEEKPEYGCFLALMPGVIAAGSTPESVSDMVRRLKGKPSDPSLATVPAFRAAAEMRNRPGLFTWIDPPRLTRCLNDLLRRELIRLQDEIRLRPLAKGEKRDPAKLRAALRDVEAQHRRDTYEWTVFQELVNPAGMRYAAAGWSLHEGEFVCRFEARMKEKQTSPLLELLPNEKISPNLLRAVPADAFALFAVPLPDGPVTLARVLKLADALAAEADEKTPPPSKALGELEKSLQLRLGRDVLAKIQSAAVAVHLVGRPDKEAGVYPVLVIEAVHEDAARDLESVLPRLYGMGAKVAEPHRHTIAGQIVHSFTAETADPDLQGLPAHYGRRGKIIVLGWHRGRVAATLRDSARPKDLLNLPRGLAAVHAEGPVSALGLLSCRQLLAHVTRIGSDSDEQTAGHLRALRYLREMGTPMATMPPTMFAVKRLSDGVRVEFRQRELPAASATVVDIALTWMLDEDAAEAVGRWQMRRDAPAGVGADIVAPAPAVPAPQKAPR